MNADAIQLMKFSEIHFTDDFFNSLRDDYPEFMDWVKRKSIQNESAYVLLNSFGKIDGFLYLKEENDQCNDITPNLPLLKHIKIGTFKVNPHNTVLGQRFLSLAFRKLLKTNSQYIYATMFDKQSELKELFIKFGFVEWGRNNRDEDVLYKNLNHTGDIYHDFPFCNCSNCRKYLLSVYPTYHLPMFPDSKLYTERNEPNQDLAVTNTIEKIYICKMQGVKFINPGDVVIVYRTNDSSGAAEYKSVATSICTVVEVKNIDMFSNVEEFLKYCLRGSVFSRDDLVNYYITKKYPYIIKMLYNIPLRKRVIRKDLIEKVGIARKAYWGCLELTDEQFQKIIELGEIDEGVIVYKA